MWNPKLGATDEKDFDYNMGSVYYGTEDMIRNEHGQGYNDGPYHIDGVSRNGNAFAHTGVHRNIISLTDISKRGARSMPGVENGRNGFTAGRRQGEMVNGVRGEGKAVSDAKKESGSDSDRRCHLCNASYTNLKDHLLQRHVL